MSAPAKQRVPGTDCMPLTAADREEAYDELRKKVAHLQAEREDRARQRRQRLWLIAALSMATLGSSLLLLLAWTWLS